MIQPSEAFQIGLCLGMGIAGVLTFPYAGRQERAAWRKREKQLAADEARARVLGSDDAVLRAQAEQMAHACMRPEPSAWERLTGPWRRL